MPPELKAGGAKAGRPSPLRVLVIAPTPFFGDRGCHVRILDEIRAVEALGVDFSVVTYPTGQDPPDVLTIRAKAVPGIKAGPLGFSPGRPILDLAVLLAAHREIRRFRPHVLHAHLHEGVAIGIVLRAWHRLPLVADLQGSLTAELVDQGVMAGGSLMATLMRTIERWLVRRPDQTLTSSSHGVQLLTAQGVDRSRVTSLPDGVDIEAFHPGPPDSTLIKRLGVAGKRVVVFLGVLTHYQGVDLLLDIAAILARTHPDVHLLVLGYPNEERYWAAAKARGLDGVMTFPGRVPYVEAARWLRVGEIAVSPKRSVTEANGKLLNYMACGLPVVASDSPVNRELLGDAGVYAPLDNAEAFAARLSELLEDPGRARALGVALRARVEKEFAWTSLARRLEGAYQDVIRGD